MEELKLSFKDDNGIVCKDLLHSEEIVQEFHRIVTNSLYSVYGISGGWGTGKTCFVKMWEDHLEKIGQVFVHIDAFKMDYESEPFIMLIKAFKDFLKKKILMIIKLKYFWKKQRKCFLWISC